MNFWKEEKKIKIYFLAPPSLPQQSLVVKKKKIAFFLHSYQRRKTYLDNDLSYFHGFQMYVALMITIYQRATPSKACENKH